MTHPESEFELARHLHPRSPAEGEYRSESLPVEFVNVNKLDALVAANGMDVTDELEKPHQRAVRLDATARLVDVFEEAGITVAAIKSFPAVPKPIGDVDLLVDEFDAAVEVLEDHGFEGFDDEPLKRVHLKCVDGVRVAIHLHGAVTWRGVSYFDARSVLEDRRWRDVNGHRFPVPIPEYEVAITAAHMLFERGNNRVSLLDVLEFATLFERFDLDSREIAELADAAGFGPPFEFFLASVNAIHRDVYGEPILDEIEEIPPPQYDPLFKGWLFPLSTIVWVRSAKLSSHAKAGEWSDLGTGLRAYVKDFLDVLTERYGVTYTSKRLRRLGREIR